MGNEWILDVLTDLRRFAAANGMGRLAEQIEDTALVAAAEIASRRGATGGRSDGFTAEEGAASRPDA